MCDSLEFIFWGMTHPVSAGSMKMTELRKTRTPPEGGLQAVLIPFRDNTPPTSKSAGLSFQAGLVRPP
ncbi:hypothetical protein ACFLXB_09665 [Chloroflexota bacterium]